MAWFLLPTSRWPIFAADGSQGAQRLIGQGAQPIAEADVPAAIAAFLAGTTPPSAPAVSDPAVAAAIEAVVAAAKAADDRAANAQQMSRNVRTDLTADIEAAVAQYAGAVATSAADRADLRGMLEALVAQGGASDATSTAKGVVQLSGDLGGTAAAPTVPGLASKVGTTDPRLSDQRAPTAHGHPSADLTDATTTGRAVLTAADGAAARGAIGAGTSNLTIGTTGTTAAAGNDGRLSDARIPTTHTHTAAQLSDSTTTGRSVITAVDGAAARAAIGAGTSSLVLGTTAATAKAGDYSPPADAVAATPSLRSLGTTATQAAAGDHAHAGGGATTPSGSYAIPRTFAQPALIPVTARTVGAANTALLMRVQDAGTITRLMAHVATSAAGTAVTLGVYRNTGVGAAARPTGAPVAQISVATTATGLITGTIPSTAVADGDWMAVGSAVLTNALAGALGLTTVDGFAYSHAALLSGTTLGTIVPASLVRGGTLVAIWGGQ